jgi:RIO kinase 1
MNHTTEYLDELEDSDVETTRGHHRKGKHTQKKRPSEPHSPFTTFDPIAQLGVEAVFRPTFAASRFERAWLLEHLGPFYEDHFIADILHQVKGGKEASVYCCAADARMGIELIAAKVYRPKIFRTLKNDAQYRQGRVALDDQGNEVRGRRESLAMRQKTRFGQDLLHAAWLANEFQTLLTLHAAGVEVPRPIAQGNNTILMEYVGEAGQPAPTLNQVALEPGKARPIFDRVVHNAELMLAHGCVHADLSAFNILYWEGDIRIIDLPQAVSPYKNPDAFKLFERDVTRVCEYFAQYGIETNAAQLARQVWKRNVQRDTADIFL